MQNQTIYKVIDNRFDHKIDSYVNELIVNENVEILFNNPKLCVFFGLIELDKEKIKRIHDKFIDFAIKKTDNKFTFDDRHRDESGDLYGFYKNMSQITCFEKKRKYCHDFRHAISNGHSKCFAHLYVNKLYPCFTVLEYVAKKCNLEYLKIIHEKNENYKKNYEISANVTYHVREKLRDHLIDERRFSAEIAKNGHIDCLKFLHKNEYQWDEDTCSFAAENGHLECLKYAHENGCPWDKNTFSYAAKNGHLDCLKYLHENGCPWDSSASIHAATNGHLGCFTYLLKCGITEFAGSYTCGTYACEVYTKFNDYAT
ncbi:ankyrin repeat domain-containing protein [Bodo saltans virus]|uniref:Ankyrin repeat domain-containing protein n=1 Tax=Bodo saltans virus TaxID=2024608 RepID=A0A2H4UTI9_9VIRU|nr:ankyrin repeat domain-containing protein [Bodo saltans virus]ATZ80167.1 ankyrin repeat domain-containing protein [Bodo saltans virus]